MPAYHVLVESYKSPDPNLAAPHSWVVHEQTKTNQKKQNTVAVAFADSPIRIRQ